MDVKGADYSLRIWLDPGKMAQYGLVPSDIRKVLDEQNLESPTGTLGAESEHTFRYVLKYRGRYDKETDYENLVVSAQENGTRPAPERRGAGRNWARKPTSTSVP